MKIALAGSFSAHDKILEIATELKDLGHEVEAPNFGHEIIHGKISSPQKKSEVMTAYFSKIEWYDALLAVNVEKRGVAGYVGCNTLVELAVAFYLKKKILLLNQIPDLPCVDEISGMLPIVLGGDLTKIREK